MDAEHHHSEGMVSKRQVESDLRGLFEFGK
jgi:hypothetical protein